MSRKKVIFFSLLFFPTFLLFGLFFKLNDYDVWYFCLGCSDSHYNFDHSNKLFMKLPVVDCRYAPPFLVLLVTSTHGQKEAREAIRQTWGKERFIQGKRVVTFFLLGSRKIESAKERSELDQESVTYNDIIQRNFIDTYYNLTIKTIMGMEWITHYCPQATYVMKTDTDMFINTLYLVDLLLKKNKTSNFFTGILKPNDSPIRNIFSKWYISKREYPGDKYPPFCSGTGYVFSIDVAQKVYNIALSTPFFKLEDVYVGICLDRLKIPLQKLHSKPTFFAERLPFSVCKYRNIVTSHEILPHEIVLYWNALQRAKEENC